MTFGFVCSCSVVRGKCFVCDYGVCGNKDGDARVMAQISGLVNMS